MFLYWLAAERRYVHRQSDIPKGVDAERVDVPTDIAGLMAYLNSLVKIEADPRPAPGEMPLAAIPVREQSAPEPPPPPPIVPDRDRAPMNAIALLSRVDSLGVNVEGVIEAIAKARGYALARYAGAIAIRYQELEKI